MKHRSALLTFSALLLAFGILATSAYALSLEEAKSRGFLGETPSGYLELVSPAAPPDAVAVMRDINAKRRNEYSAIANKNGTAIQTVETLAGIKAMERTAPGNFIKSNNAWVKK